MRTRTIGTRQVSAIGFGEAGLSVADQPPEEVSTRVIQAAHDAGITLFDTATCYVPSHDRQGHGERLLTGALRGRSDVLIASKAGLERISTIEFSRDFEVNGSPEAIRRQCEATLRALGTERIDLYQLHAPDHEIPIAETMGAFAELRSEGKIDLVGVCNVTVEQLDQARSAVEIASVQNAFSPGKRESADLIERCSELGIAFLAYSPLGGLGDRARSLPDAHPAFARLAAERGVSPYQVALAWELAQGPTVIPLVGARRTESIVDSAAAADLDLTPDELEALAA